MSIKEESTITNEDIIEKKMEEKVIRTKHLNFEKKAERKRPHPFWKRKYSKRGRTGHKKQDKRMIIDRKAKEIQDIEYENFIYIKETEKNAKKNDLLSEK